MRNLQNFPELSIYKTRGFIKYTRSSFGVMNHTIKAIRERVKKLHVDRVTFHPNTPTIATFNIANRVGSPKDVAGNQRVKHNTPHRNASMPDVATLDVQSPIKPIIGLPKAVPKSRKPIMPVV